MGDSESWDYTHDVIIFGCLFASAGTHDFPDIDQSEPATFAGRSGATAESDLMARKASQSTIDAGIGAGRIWQERLDQLLA